ncbi:hypothetical protein M422DRAFT_36399, partial [Sphaerobolus stellatus SS14]
SILSLSVQNSTRYFEITLPASCPRLQPPFVTHGMAFITLPAGSPRSVCITRVQRS